MLHKFLFLFTLSLVAFLNMSYASACSCAVPSSQTDASYIENAAAIVTLDVLDSGTDQIALMSANIRISKVYKGDLKEGQEITISSKEFGSCTNTIPAGAKNLDMLLFAGENGYELGIQCAVLSAEGWEKLKQGEK